LETYPRLAGIGTTAGENMAGLTSEEREQWLWETYGKGIQDFNVLHPEREVSFIHRNKFLK